MFRKARSNSNECISTFRSSQHLQRLAKHLKRATQQLPTFFKRFLCRFFTKSGQDEGVIVPNAANDVVQSLLYRVRFGLSRCICSGMAAEGISFAGWLKELRELLSVHSVLCSIYNVCLLVSTYKVHQKRSLERSTTTRLIAVAELVFAYYH